MNTNHFPNSYYSKPSILISTPVAVLMIVVLYILLSEASFLITIHPGSVSPIFPAAGLALASILVFGRRILFGIWLGAFFSNIIPHLYFTKLLEQPILTHIAVSSSIAIGAVIAALIGEFTVTRFCKHGYALYSGKNILALQILGAVSYSSVTSLIGVISLLLGGLITKDHFSYTFQTWWLGDAIGIVIFSPLILAWFSKDSFQKNNFKISELSLFSIVTILLCFFVFFQHGDFKYFIIPLLLWSAYQFGVRCTTIVIVAISIFATVTTSHGIGPFVTHNLNSSILHLDLYLGVISICSLFLTGILAERQRAEDITKISEINLRKNQDILQSTIESPKDISIYSIDRNYQYVNFNTFHKSIMKETYLVDIAIGTNMLNCLPAEEAILSNLRSTFDKTFSGENSTILRYFHQDDTYWKTKYNPIFNAQNEIIGATSFSLNISDQKHAEKKLLDSEEKLRKNQDILQSTIESPKDISIYSVDRKYKYLSFNKIHSDYMELSNHITIVNGMNLLDCISNEKSHRDTKSRLGKVFEGECTTLIKYNSVDDTHWEIKCSPIINKNQEIIGATVFSINITNRIKAEEKLKLSETKYRDIFENVQDVFFQTDYSGAILDISPSIEHYSDYTVDELIGASVFNLYVNQEDLLRFFTELMKTGTLRDYEIKLKTKSGTIKYISTNAKAILAPDGKLSHIDGALRDISERKKHEFQIENQNKKLQIQNKELEQFAYITSHDLQEPLLTLKCFSDLIKEEFSADLNENIKQYLDFILESSDRMQKLIKGLLDYSRIGNQIEITTVDCNEMVNDAISSLSDLVKENKAQIELQDLPSIEGYSVELIQLFQQLISNAVKFRKKEIPLLINISAKSVEDNWLFSVADNGIGIEEKNKEKVFIIFKRLNNRDDFAGIGIGLAICKKIIELHGGTIWVESKFGQGTIINFTIPKK